MLLLPVRSPLIRPGDDLAAIIGDSAREIHPPGMQSGDILVLSSKVLATAEGRIIHLAPSQPDEALTGEFIRRLSEACGKTPQFCEAVLQELSRMHGRVLRTCPGAALTEVSPEGLREGTILIANAGLDDSNAPQGHAIGWPEDAGKSVVRLRREIETRVKMDNGKWKMENEGSPKKIQIRIGVVISDSCVHPRRNGVAAFALAVSGFDPVRSRVGSKDLFGRRPNSICRAS
jgi:F420-0:gamma-glutamyl ligase